MPSRIQIRSWRRNGQSGSEIVEFALLAFFLVPTFLWMFVNSMNMIRMIEATEVTRDIGDQYIHGVDYTTYEAEAVAQKLATGFGLQIGSSFTGNNPYNDGNSGAGSNAWIVVAEIMYVGNQSCAALPQGTTCTNQNKYVFLQWIDFGNKALTINGAQVVSALGTPNLTLCTGNTQYPSCDINSNGMTLEYLVDANAQATTAASFFQTQLSDGQVAYVAETFFASPDLNFSSYPAGGIHSMNFF
jgi:hypothetical protein